MKRPDVYNYAESVLKGYGFIKHNFRIYHLNDELELTISTGNQVGNKEYEFQISDMTERPPGRMWGGYISSIKFDHTLDENILFTTFDTWIAAVFELEELQKYARAIKMKKICDGI